jgi:hypothetical protein
LPNISEKILPSTRRTLYRTGPTSQTPYQILVLTPAAAAAEEVVAAEAQESAAPAVVATEEAAAAEAQEEAPAEAGLVDIASILGAPTVTIVRSNL